MAELARARLAGSAGDVIVARAEDLPYEDGTFHAAVSVCALDFAAFDEALRELARVVRPGGRVVVGQRNPRGLTRRWNEAVVLRGARAVKRVADVGRPLPPPKRPPLSHARALAAVEEAGLEVLRAEPLACAVVPDPLDRLLPRTAYRAALAAERSPRLRRAFGTQRLILAARR